MASEDVIQTIKNNIKSYDGFPKDGIIFRDIFSVLRSPDTFKLLMQQMKEKIVKLPSEIDVIVGLDARGFLFGSILSYELNKPFVPLRKKGKLPGNVERQTYKLEYGEDSIEIQKGSIQEGDRVVIVDDLLATGGTLKAAADLVTKIGATISLCMVCIELKELNGRAKVPSYKVESIVEF